MCGGWRLRCANVTGVLGEGLGSVMCGGGGGGGKQRQRTGG